MPLKRMLEEGRSFGPKAVALLLEAFDGIVAELDLRSAADREKAAKIVMRLALGRGKTPSKRPEELRPLRPVPRPVAVVASAGGLRANERANERMILAGG
jgi:hypothetical protein